MMAVSIRKEEQSKYCTFDEVNVFLQEKQIEAIVLEKTSDGQILTTKCSQTVHNLKITQIEESEEDITGESSLEKCCCYCFTTCSCDKLMSKFESCQDSHLF